MSKFPALILGVGPIATSATVFADYASVSDAGLTVRNIELKPKS